MATFAAESWRTLLRNLWRTLWRNRGVLCSGISSLACESPELQSLIDNYGLLTAEGGFKFLNSLESIDLQEEMRVKEGNILNGSELGVKANEDIDLYENSMIRNIYAHCEQNQFDTAVFMCGVAHRSLIIQKIGKRDSQEELNPNWIFWM